MNQIERQKKYLKPTLTRTQTLQTGNCFVVLYKACNEYIFWPIAFNFFPTFQSITQSGFFGTKNAETAGGGYLSIVKTEFILSSLLFSFFFFFLFFVESSLFAFVASTAASVDRQKFYFWFITKICFNLNLYWNCS